MGPVPLFVELCAGTAALSLRLHARGARPPVSRMGAKTGYADCILRVLGLAPGARAAHYLWCEPDPGVRLLLEAYRDADLSRAAAVIIRSWADEEPRALWERLRAEGLPRLPATGAEVARWQVLSAWAFRAGEPKSGFNAGAVYPQPATATHHGGNGRSVATEAAAWDGFSEMPATIHPDARTVDPREVARWAVVGAWSFRAGEPASGFNRSEAEGHPESHKHPRNCQRLSAEHDALPSLPATIAPDAREVHPPALPPGTIAYLDGPYQGTTPYAHDLPRAEQVTLARRWQAAGAVVCISEAEPIPELTADGWHAVRIDGERQGQKRTFSRQQAEWLTLSHEPAWRPSVQAGLFA